jgi:hypothetical protein
MVIASKAKQSCSFKEIATHLAGARNDWLITTTYIKIKIMI